MPESDRVDGGDSPLPGAPAVQSVASSCEGSPSDPGRREALQLAGVSAMPMLLASAAQAQSSRTVRSPLTEPFVMPMRVVQELPSRPLTDPAFARPPRSQPDRAINPVNLLPYEGRGDAHQLRELNPPRFFYAQRFGAVPPTSIHPSLPLQVNLWGANLGGDLQVDKPTTPMPTIVSRYQAGSNTAILVRRFNNLPTGVPSGGFGKNQISTHLHNFHAAPDSDGGPCDPGLGALSEDPRTQGRFFFPGQYYDYYYNMKRVGFTLPGTPDGDVKQTLSTLWYHDHREAHTAENVYKGLYGFHLIFNEFDTGDETKGFRLPSYPQFDIPIVFADIKIDPRTLQATVDLAENDGHLGDKYLVNGRIQPYFEVRKRRYRFRLLNGSIGRHYRLYITNPDNPAQSIPVWRIGNDGGYYERPLLVTDLKMAPAERADIVVDFAKLTAPGGAAAGARRLWLENREIQTNLRKPEDKLAPPAQAGNALVEWRIGAPAPDASQEITASTSFAALAMPAHPPPGQMFTRTFKWERKNGMWACNGQFIDCTKVRFAMKRGRWERWIHKTGGGWAHPIHNHFVQGMIVKRNGVAITPGSVYYVRKDVFPLYPGDELEVLHQPLDYKGVYPMHCHNTLHEDFAMMLLYRVDDVGDNNREP
jgi:FtsP/CotA-like multicopper oxidase with cupredoxin domain